MTTANYAEAKCAYCEGSGNSNGTQCVACLGNGNIMVAQPPRQCAHCQGKGRKSAYRCNFCKGTGWGQALRPSPK